MTSMQPTTSASGAAPVPPGVRDALSEVLDEGKQLAAGHLELRMLEIRGLIEGYASRTFAACVAMLFALAALVCLSVAAVQALSRTYALDVACALVGGGYALLTAILLWRATKPVHAFDHDRSDERNHG